MSTEVVEKPVVDKAKQAETVRSILNSFAPKPADEKKPAPAEQSKEEAKPAEKPKEEAPKAEEKPAEQQDPPKEEKKPKTKAPKVIRAEELLDEDAITKAATAAATAAVKATQKQEEPPAEPELPRSVQRKMDIFKELETDPRFKGITKQVVEFKKAGGTEDQYKAQWLKDNPGKKFDPNDDDHTDWYADNDPTAKHDDIDEAVEEAQARLLEKRSDERATKIVEERLSKREQEERRRQAAPLADQAAQESVMEAIEALDPKLVEVVQKSGEKGLADEDPIAYNILSSVAGTFAPLISETVRIAEGLTAPDDRNPLHATLNRVAGEIENSILELDPAERVKVFNVGGQRVQKRFATMEDFQNMPSEKRARYWTVGKDEILYKLKADQKAIAKGQYDAVVGAAKKRFGQGSAQAAQTQQAKPSQQTASTAASTHVSPSVGSSTPAPAPKADDGSKKVDPVRSFLSSFRPV